MLFVIRSHSCSFMLYFIIIISLVFLHLSGCVLVYRYTEGITIALLSSRTFI